MAKVLIVQWLIVGFVLESFIEAAPFSETKANKLNVAIIGAGPSGLVSAKYALAQGFDVTVYEQHYELGGIWAYTDKIGKNRFGVNIHSPMYKYLRFVLFTRFALFFLKKWNLLKKFALRSQFFEEIRFKKPIFSSIQVN